jgi:hypothetical protein
MMSGWDQHHDIESYLRDMPTPKLSTGQDSTLGNWRDLVAAFFGEGPALDYLDGLIAEDGRDEVVIAEEGQMLYLLAAMQRGQSDAVE